MVGESYGVPAPVVRWARGHTHPSHGTRAKNTPRTAGPGSYFVRDSARRRDGIQCRDMLLMMPPRADKRGSSPAHTAPGTQETMTTCGGGKRIASPGRPLLRPAHDAGGDSRVGGVVVVLDPPNRGRSASRPLAVDDSSPRETRLSEQIRASDHCLGQQGLDGGRCWFCSEHSFVE